MSYYAISGSPLQYQKSNGGFAQNYYLKHYIASTTTTLQVGMNTTTTDELGNLLLMDKVRLNALGYPVSPSGSTIVIHADQEYKQVLYKNATDADNNNTAAAEWVIDNIAIGLIGYTPDDPANDAADIDYSAGNTATTRALENKLRESLSVTDFGADPTGVLDSSVAFVTALLAGLTISVPDGVYLLGGLIVQTDYQSLRFGGSVTLKANANGVVLFKQVSSYALHHGGFKVDSNGKTNIIGLQCGPSSQIDTTTLSHQVSCVLPSIKGDSGTSELCIVQTGPDVSGTDSTNRNNIFGPIIGNGARRALYIKAPANATASTPRFNVFLEVSEKGTAGTTNAGITIESGTGNTILNANLEGITAGTTPFATPTALRFYDQCPTTSIANNNNRILAGSIVSCTRDLQNANATTYLGALAYDLTKISNSAYPVQMGAMRGFYQADIARVSSTGTAVKLPTGWSSTRNSLGIYTIDHLYGTANIMPFVSVLDGDSTIAVDSISSTQIVVNVKTSGALADQEFMVVVFRY